MRIQGVHAGAAQTIFPRRKLNAGVSIRSCFIWLRNSGSGWRRSL